MQGRKPRGHLAHAQQSLRLARNNSLPSRCATVMTVDALNTVRMAAWILESVSKSTFAAINTHNNPCMHNLPNHLP